MRSLLGRLACVLGWHRMVVTWIQEFEHFPTHALVYRDCRRCPAKRCDLGHLHPKRQ